MMIASLVFLCAFLVGIWLNFMILVPFGLAIMVICLVLLIATGGAEIIAAAFLYLTAMNLGFLAGKFYRFRFMSPSFLSRTASSSALGPDRTA